MNTKKQPLALEVKAIDKYTIPKILDLYKQSGNNIAATAKKMGVKRNELMGRINADSDLYEAVFDYDAEMGDDAVSALHLQIKKGNMKAIEFFLKEKGQSMGYNVPRDNSDEVTERLVISTGGDEIPHLKTKEDEEKKDK